MACTKAKKRKERCHPIETHPLTVGKRKKKLKRDVVYLRKQNRIKSIVKVEFNYSAGEIKIVLP